MIFSRFGASACAAMAYLLPGIVQADFNHPGILHSGGELRYLSQQYEARQHEGHTTLYWEAFEQTVDKAVIKAVSDNEDEKLKTYKQFSCLQPTNVKGNGHLPGEPCSTFPKDGFHAYILALKWAVSKDEYYGSLSRKILLAWANEFQDIDDDDFGIYGTRIQASKTTSWAAAQFANAAEILKTYTQSPIVWTPADTTLSNTFFTELLKVIDRASDENSIANDIQAKIEARLAIAVFMDNIPHFDAAIELWEEKFRNTVYLRSDGAEPFGPELINGRTKKEHWGNPLGYGNTNVDGRMPDGFQLETCRDLSHVDIGFRAMMYAAQTALHQGIDLYDDESERLTAFMNYHARLEMGTVLQPQVCGDAEANYKVRCKPQLRAGVAPDCPIDTWYLAYHNLTNRLGYDMSDADYLIQQEEDNNVWVAPPANGYKWLIKWEGFTHAHGLYGDEHNLWRRCDVRNGQLYSFRNANSGRHLFASNGNLVEYGGRSTGPYRQYEAIYAGKHRGDRYYRFKNTISNNTFSVKHGSTERGANVFLFMARPASKASQFKLEKQQNGACQLIPRHSNDMGLSRCVGGHSRIIAQHVNFTNIQLGNCSTDKNNQWFVTHEGAAD